MVINTLVDAGENFPHLTLGLARHGTVVTGCRVEKPGPFDTGDGRPRRS